MDAQIHSSARYEMRSDLQLLIIEPREDLAVEYKSWLNLDQPKDKATLAKACIALANHGGGSLIIGFDEQNGSLRSVSRPTDHAEITQDAINGVVARYADPPFHCQLHNFEHPMTGVTHFIVSVPGDQIVPVISKRGYQKTIQSIQCYIRKPGPRSEQPQSTEEWRTLLRRCVLAEREDLLNAIRSIVTGRAGVDTETSDSRQLFNAFRVTSLARWKALTKDLSPESPERFPYGYYEVAVHPINATPVETVDILRERLAHAQRIELTGWPPFLELSQKEWKPYPLENHIEAWIGRRNDENSPREAYRSDYWRASKSGELYTIRGYLEDSYKARTMRQVEPGTVFDLTLPIWRIGEILYFATRFLAEFRNVQAIMIKCRFVGINDRIITSLDLRHWTTDSRPCRSNEVVTTATVDLKQLEDNMVEIVYQLLMELYEHFDFYKLAQTLVKEELSKLRGRSGY